MKGNIAILKKLSIFGWIYLIANSLSMAMPVEGLPPAEDLRGEYGHIHDPAIAKSNSVYTVFSTGPGLTVHTSPDRVLWKKRAPVFPVVPLWIKDIVPKFTDSLWAPDISFFQGRWHLYYAASQFGTNLSVIGLATNATLDLAAPDYQWRDEGPVLQSHRGDDWNAIDPNVVLDRAGEPWLVFGSFWSGIQLRKLDAATGKLEEKQPLQQRLASRSMARDGTTAIEAPFVVLHGDYFYLFVSYDQCCEGAKSTYNLRVGRARELVGPYLDRAGQRMSEGNATPLLGGAGRWRGPGHNAVLRDGGDDWLIYHSYDAEDGGVPKLRIQKILWDAEGWPTVAEVESKN